MNKTKIDWCTMSWNPVTGCLHECEYCYARGIANRFAATETPDPDSLFSALYRTDGLCELSEPIRNDDGKIQAFPNDFDPTFHRYRLDEPAKKKKPQTIFVGSMCDLFGEWVPDEWIKAVFDACAAAPWHRYLFLTKNPKRYTQGAVFECGATRGIGERWFGTTVTNQEELNERMGKLPLYRKCFLSIEPIFEGLQFDPNDVTDLQTSPVKWVIIGAETGNRKGKVIPKREWIENIVTQCREAGIPIFMKESLRGLMGSDFVQEFGWKTKTIQPKGDMSYE